jgi:CHAT domain-containing protein
MFLNAAAPPLEQPLVRLTGTAQEIRSCARAWSGADASAVVLVGPAGGRTSVLEALERGPQVAHFATHVVQGDKSADSAYLALALDSSGRPDFLIPAEISNRRFSIDLVTLSACNSGGGKTYPGAGLFGLTRAWLLAGARAVVATHWPMADDSGELFQPFYSSLKSGAAVNSATVAKALQAAQIAMLRSDSRRRSEPGYWASFFVIGKD